MNRPATNYQGSAVMKMNQPSLGQVGPGGGQEGPPMRIYATMTLMTGLAWGQ